VKIRIHEIFNNIYQLNNPTQNGFLCKIVQLSDWQKYFFYFSQIEERFGHPKFEN
jgi:hypothetical protein